MTGINDEYALIADLYDHVGLYRTRGDIDFYVEAAREYGTPVLEVGCGTGRVLIPTARAGMNIVGLDLSQSMLGICRTRLLQEPDAVRSKVRLIHGDMRTFNAEEMFRLATVPFRPFQHLLTVEDQLACLESIRRHLVRGGRLILDLFNPSLEGLLQRSEEIPAEPEFTTPDGRRVVRRPRIVSRDYFMQVNRIELVYDVKFPDGREQQLVHAFDMRYLFRFEVEHMLVRSGFEVENLYADHNKSPYGTKYPGELVFVAKKR